MLLCLTLSRSTHSEYRHFAISPGCNCGQTPGRNGTARALRRPVANLGERLSAGQGRGGGSRDAVKERLRTRAVEQKADEGGRNIPSYRGSVEGEGDDERNYLRIPCCMAVRHC